VIGIRGGIGILSQGPNGLQVGNLNGVLTYQNGATTNSIITGFMVNIPNWNTPPGPPFPIPSDLAIHYITILSSTGTQNGSGPPLNSLPTNGFTCGTNSTPACPQTPWSPTNTGENNAAQIINQATQHATEATPHRPRHRSAAA
jgi:hypothetical protein